MLQVIEDPEVADLMGLPRKMETPLDVDMLDIYNGMAWRIIHDTDMEPEDVYDWHIGLRNVSPQAKILVTDMGPHFESISPSDVVIEYIMLELDPNERRYFNPETNEITREQPSLSMRLSEFIDIDKPPAATEGCDEDLVQRARIEAQDTVKRNFGVSKEEARKFAETFVDNLASEGRLTEEFVISEPFYFKILNDFA